MMRVLDSSAVSLLSKMFRDIMNMNGVIVPDWSAISFGGVFASSVVTCMSLSWLAPVYVMIFKVDVSELVILVSLNAQKTLFVLLEYLSKRAQTT
jgi:hypothetical protein